MKKVFMILIAFLLLTESKIVMAQVSVNMDNSGPDPSAILDVKSANLGFLPPRVALTATNDADPVNSPASGLFVYNTATAGISPNNVQPGYYCWNGNRWLAVIVPMGTTPGEMLYWNGGQWMVIPAGLNGQVLTFSNGVPVWGGVQLPVLNTTAITSIAPNSANSGGTIASDGGAPVTVRGVCWSTSPAPTIANSKTTDGSGTGNFASVLSGFTPNTTYYVRSYATNSAGTAYGNQLSFNSPIVYTIGQSYGGGIIFYLDGTGSHGLIAATSDQSAGASWGCWGTYLGTSATLGTGQANTSLVVNGGGVAGNAACICNELILNGFDDWFLPSKEELNQMYIQRAVIGGFTDNNYWSSTEYGAWDAWGQYFNNGLQYLNTKNSPNLVRAVRAF